MTSVNAHRHGWVAGEADAECLISSLSEEGLSVTVLARFDFQFGRAAVFELSVSVAEGITEVERLGPGTSASSRQGATEGQAMDATRAAFTRRQQEARAAGSELAQCDVVAALLVALELSRGAGQTLAGRHVWYPDLCSFLDCVHVAAAKGPPARRAAFARAECTTLAAQLVGLPAAGQAQTDARFDEAAEFLALQRPYAPALAPAAAAPAPQPELLRRAALFTAWWLAQRGAAGDEELSAQSLSLAAALSARPDAAMRQLQAAAARAGALRLAPAAPSGPRALAPRRAGVAVPRALRGDAPRLMPSSRIAERLPLPAALAEVLAARAGAAATPRGGSAAGSSAAGSSAAGGLASWNSRTRPDAASPPKLLRRPIEPRWLAVREAKGWSAGPLAASLAAQAQPHASELQAAAAARRPPAGPRALPWGGGQAGELEEGGTEEPAPRPGRWKPLRLPGGGRGSVFIPALDPPPLPAPALLETWTQRRGGPSLSLSLRGAAPASQSTALSVATPRAPRATLGCFREGFPTRLDITARALPEEEGRAAAGRAPPVPPPGLRVQTATNSNRKFGSFPWCEARAGARQTKGARTEFDYQVGKEWPKVGRVFATPHDRFAENVWREFAYPEFEGWRRGQADPAAYELERAGICEAGRSHRVVIGEPGALCQPFVRLQQREWYPDGVDNFVAEQFHRDMLATTQQQYLRPSNKPYYHPERYV
jgi:hypothetical protein